MSSVTDTASNASSSFVSCAESEEDTVIMSKAKNLPPVDPAVLANTDPWVKLLFDRFDIVEQNNTERHDDYKANIKKLSEQQAKTSTDVANLKHDVEDLTNDLGEAHDKIDRVSSDLENHKAYTDRKFEELLAKLDAKSSTVKVQVPSLSVAQQCSVEDKFQALVKETEAMQTIFVVGKVPSVRPTVSLTTLMKRHFEQHGGKLLPTGGKSRTRRFAVPVDKIDDTKGTIRHYNMAIRDLGYWVVQDAPPALRKLNSNAFAFFKYAKDIFKILRRFRWEAEAGYVTVDELPFLPVYLVSCKKKKWKALAGLLTELVADVLEKDWLETASSALKIPDDFVTKWCAVLERDECDVPPLDNEGSAVEEQSAQENGAFEDEDMEEDVVASGGG
jgi:hypothetical protein